MQEARNVYKARNVNYLMVDWRKGAWAGYDQATADTQLIGRSIAYAFNQLKEQGHQEIVRNSSLFWGKILKLFSLTELSQIQTVCCSLKYSIKRLKWQSIDRDHLNVLVIR